MKTIKTYHRAAVRRSVRAQKHLLPRWGNRYGQERVWTHLGDRTEESTVTVRNPSMRPLIHNGKKNR